MKMLPCKEVSRMVSRGLDHEAGLGERMALRLHFLICEGCRNFNRQVHFLRRAMRELPEQGDGGPG